MWWLLPIIAVFGMLVLARVSRRAPRRAAPRQDRTAREDDRQLARSQGWVVDVLVGISTGAPIAYGIGQSILAGGSAEVEVLDGVVFALCGAVLGVGFMRVIRRPRPLPDRSSRSADEPEDWT
jgi:hypothetical protein